MNEEIKEWKTQSVKHKIADRLRTCYGCSLKPIIEEYFGEFVNN